jgi:hypothetical protein
VGQGKSTEGCIDAPAGLIAWWPLDSADMIQPNCQDIAGPYDGHVACGNPQPVAGKVGQACRFDWNNMGVIRTSSQSDPFQVIGEGDFTIDAWIYPEDMGYTCQNLANSQDLNHCEDRIILDNYTNNRHKFNPPEWPNTGSGAMAFFVRNEQWDANVNQWTSMKLGLAMNTQEFICTDALIVPNLWQHVAVTISRSSGTPTGTFYLSGSPIGATFTPDTGTLYDTNFAFLGFPQLDIGHAPPKAPCLVCHNCDDFFNGRLDEIEIFNRVLDPTEIQDIFAADSSGKCKGNAECRCTGWNDATVSFFGTTKKGLQPSNRQLQAPCGSSVNIQSLEGPITVNASVYCSSFCSTHYSWTVRRTSPPGNACAPSSEPVVWTGSGNTATFTPSCGGQFTVTFDASCDGWACHSCQIVISVDQLVSFICHCQSWNPMTVSWSDAVAGNQTVTRNCGDNVTINMWNSCTDIKITSGGVSCGPGCTPSNYTWSVADLSSSQTWNGNGLTALFNPVIDSPTTAPFHDYLVTFNANCDGIQCECDLKIRINSAECTCLSWNPATITWTGSSPGTWTAPCGGGAPVKIESVNIGTAVQISAGVTCNPAGLQPTYTWSITSSSGATVASGSGSTASFIPQVMGSYTAVFNASCGTDCHASCSIPIQINNVTKRHIGGISGIPFTCSCGAWSPATVTWPGGSQNVSCTPAAQAPVVNIPSITPGSAVQINSSVACGPGIFNIFTHEACQANENWTVTSVFSGQGPWTGSGSTASFTPTKEGSFIVVFNASCGSAACSTCEIHIDIKNMETGGLQLSAPVIISFTASQTQVNAGDRVVLNWVITGEGNASLTCGGESQPVSFTGSMVVTPPQSGCCTLTVSNQAGSDQKTVCITVLPPKVTPPKVTPPKPTPPVINSFSARCPQPSPAARTPGTCTLSWSVTGPAGTTVSITGIGSVGLSGATQVALGGVYTLTATSPGGSVSRTVQAQ